MKTFHASRASPGEAGDYYQVLFEEVGEGRGQYWLVQRSFEPPDDGYYVEDDACNWTGHHMFLKAELGRGHFLTVLGLGGRDSVRVTFDLTDAEFRKLARVIRIMLPDVRLVGDILNSLCRRHGKHIE